MTHRPRAWILNLDAEHELEAQKNYAPTLHVKALVARERQRLIGQLVGPYDVLVTEELLERSGEAADRARGLPGFAWSPTPRALALLKRAGALPVTAPSIEVLRTVNARAFAVNVRAPLAKSSFEKHVVDSLEAALAQLAKQTPDGWLVRRTFGAAGRGRRRLRAGSPSPDECAWLAASLCRGALVIEPWVRVTGEYTRSAWVHQSGETIISPPCFQSTTEHGAWTHTERAERGGVLREDDARLEEAVAVAGAALARAGYFGAFGIDAYRHRVPGEVATVLNPLSEINARFTMDWATAMAARALQGEAVLRLDEFAQGLALQRQTPTISKL